MNYGNQLNHLLQRSMLKSVYLYKVLSLRLEIVKTKTLAAILDSLIMLKVWLVSVWCSVKRKTHSLILLKYVDIRPYLHKFPLR